MTTTATTTTTYPEYSVGIERRWNEEELKPVHPVPQDIAARQIHGHDGPAELKQRKEAPVHNKGRKEGTSTGMFQCCMTAHLPSILADTSSQSVTFKTQRDAHRHA